LKIREYLYIQRETAADFHEEFGRIGDDYEGEPPSSGGIMNEEAAIKTMHGGMSLDLRGVSFRGDIRILRGVIEDHCRRRGLLFGTISTIGIHLSNDVHVPWSACETFCDRPSRAPDT